MSAVARDTYVSYAHALVRARERSITDPVWFARNVLNLRVMPGEKSLDEDPNDSWELDQWTVNLLEAAGDVVRAKENLPTVINHEGLNQISVRAMHGPGKTFGLAVLIHWFGFCFNAKIPCTAPKIQQLKTRLWPEFRKIRNRAIPGYRDLMKIHGTQIRWMDVDGAYEEGPWAFMETASAPENLAGLHHKYMMICVDEASGVDEKLWPVIESAISTGSIVLLVIISNPTRIKGTFADSHLKPKVAKSWFRLHIRLDDTKRVSRAWVQRMIDKYGAESPVVKVRCFGEFASEDENQLISLEWLERARYREFEEDGSFPRRRISVDVADGGSAFSVVTVAEHYDSFVHMVKQKQFSFPGGRAVGLLQDEVEKMWREHKFDVRNGDDIVVDSLGVGAGLCSNLCERYPVIRYIGGESADGKLYRNRRSQSYIVCRDRFRDDKIVIAEDFLDDDEWDDFDAQMTAMRRKPGIERVEDIITKQELVDLHGPESNFDRADSVAMQFATQTPILGAVSDLILMGAPTETSRYDASLT